MRLVGEDAEHPNLRPPPQLRSADGHRHHRAAVTPLIAYRLLGWLLMWPEAIMTSERFSKYRFELSGTQLPDSGKWVPYLEIRDFSEDPDDGEVIFPMQRIAADDVFDSEKAAEAEARRFAISHVSSGEF